jgi:hypothetical protein
VADLLHGYNQFRHLRKPPPAVLVRMDDKLVKAEKLNVLDHRHAPLLDQHPKEDLFLLNYKESRYTSNIVPLVNIRSPRWNRTKSLAGIRRPNETDGSRISSILPSGRSRNSRQPPLIRICFPISML